MRAWRLKKSCVAKYVCHHFKMILIVSRKYAIFGQTRYVSVLSYVN